MNICFLWILLLSAIVIAVVTAQEEDPAHWGTVACTTAACRFKDSAEAWRAEDAALRRYVESHVPAVLQHTGAAAFDEHLKGVQAVLRFWQAPAHLAKAGLLHSIYGTEGFQGFALPLRERAAVRELIGAEAEYLCWVFCMVDRATLDQTMFDWNVDAATTSNQTYVLYARPELGRFALPLSHEQWLDFIELSLADWLEQVEGAAQKPSEIYGWQTGQAYAYRRTAYAQACRILAAERGPRLATVAPAMWAAVMATESAASRHLIQTYTPPVSAAARLAREALVAAGQATFPRDYAPQPMNAQQQEQCLTTAVNDARKI